jgi:hypothetical protein
MSEMTRFDYDDERQLPAELAAVWRADAIRRSERTGEFWRRQQFGIRARIRTENIPKPRSLRLAVATAALVFFAVLLIAPAGPPPQPALPQAKVDPDQELLLAVEHALSAGTPAALEPLTLVVESSSNNDVETISHKEHSNEN